MISSQRALACLGAAVAALAGACREAPVGPTPGAEAELRGPQPGAAAASDFSGVYEVAVLDTPPRLANATEAQAALRSHYPEALRAAGVSGRTVAQFVIGRDGLVVPTSIQVLSADREEFAAATREALALFRFRPGRYQGNDVPVVIQMPIAWMPPAAQ